MKKVLSTVTIQYRTVHLLHSPLESWWQQSSLKYTVKERFAEIKVWERREHRTICYRSNAGTI